MFNSNFFLRQTALTERKTAQFQNYVAKKFAIIEKTVTAMANKYTV